MSIDDAAELLAAQAAWSIQQTPRRFILEVEVAAVNDGIGTIFAYAEETGNRDSGRHVTGTEANIGCKLGAMIVQMWQAWVKEHGRTSL